MPIQQLLQELPQITGCFFSILTNKKSPLRRGISPLSKGKLANWNFEVTF
jgi:hypothetical protein